GGGRRALEEVIDGRDAAVRVARRPREAEKLGRETPIDREPRAGDRARAERTAVGARVRRLEPRAVALELFDYRQQVVRHRRRLRALRVRVDGKHRVAVTIREL